MGFDDAGLVAYEHIYWDQASLLAQIGLLDPKALPVTGAEQARRLMDPGQPANELDRAIAHRRGLSSGGGRAGADFFGKSFQKIEIRDRLFRYDEDDREREDGPEDCRKYGSARVIPRRPEAPKRKNAWGVGASA